MTSSIQHFIEGWLFDPTVGKFISTTLAILVVIALVRLFRKLLNRYIQEPGNLYRAKKMVTFLGYFIGLSIVVLPSATVLARWPSPSEWLAPGLLSRSRR